MVFSDLRNMVSYWLDDLNLTYFTSAQVNLWLNNAQREAQKLLLQSGEQWYTKVFETPLVINQPDYTLPSDFLKMHRLEIIMSGSFPSEQTDPINPCTVNQQDIMNFTVGTPEGYYIKKDKIILVPAPDTVRTMRMWYSPLVTDMVNDNDTPDVPPQYHEMLPIMATIDGLIKDQRDPTLMLNKRAYYENMMKTDATQRREDAPRSVVVTTDGGFGSLF